MLKRDNYLIERWGESYYGVNDQGNITVCPEGKGSGDLYELVESLVKRGIEAPILIRFNGIIRDRIRKLNFAFQQAMQELDYKGAYRLAFPIKVNPQRHVVETVLEAGRDSLVGLEVGSKPELIAVMTLEKHDHSLLLCNGYKDVEYISLALLAHKLGKQTLIIIEQAYELKLVLDIAEKLDVEAQIGFRMKLSTKGSGKWISSGGENSKFGLFTHEIVDGLKQLKEKGKTQCLKLLHFHLGSQVSSIESIKSALNEGSRMFTEISQEASHLCYFDVGGGLAIDYDGTRSVSDSSMNYTLEEYARNVVCAIYDACRLAGISEPTIISESGRAIVSYHSILITEVIDVTSFPKFTETTEDSFRNETLSFLLSIYKELNSENCREIFHDVMEMKQQILDEFMFGRLNLNERAYAEKLCRLIFVKLQSIFEESAEVYAEAGELDKILLETYFCNFSVFQSLPDSWAIQQLFPVMPIHRLKEKHSKRAVLADLSCDSDGKIDLFISKRGHKKYIDLHEYKGEPYYLGIFLVGAYQEILGGLHNLFGDTNVAYAEVDEKGVWEISGIVEGDTMEEVLRYVQYDPENLSNRLHAMIESALKKGTLTPLESAQIKKKFKQSLESYTYLVV